jgi:hypothetical protein
LAKSTHEKNTYPTPTLHLPYTYPTPTLEEGGKKLPPPPKPFYNQGMENRKGKEKGKKEKERKKRMGKRLP